MFGTSKKIEEAKAEGAKFAFEQSRTLTIKILDKQLKECETPADCNWLCGAAELAEKQGFINHNEYLRYFDSAFAKRNAYEKERREKEAQKAAERKAERVAKAKAAKEVQKNG